MSKRQRIEGQVNRNFLLQLAQRDAAADGAELAGWLAGWQPDPVFPFRL